jgi:hypothetical protein
LAGNEPLVTEILEGERRELRLLAARGLVPLPPGELVGVQVRLAEGSDEEVAEAAARAILETEPKIVSALVAETPDREILRYLGRHGRNAATIEALIHRRDVPHSVLVELASRVDEDLQEVLLLRQDAIVDHPEIIEALEKNPRLGSYSRRRVREYREHLLRRERRPKESTSRLEEEAEALTDGDLAKAIDEVRALPDDGEKDEDLTGLSESQIRALSVAVRMRLARGAPRGLRSILIRDPNPMVATSVLSHNALGEAEIEQIARNRSVVAEVLETIGNQRTWTRKYSIVVALVRNPRAPVAVAMRYLPRLSVRDLEGLGRDRNVPDAVRTTARRLYTMKRS